MNDTWINILIEIGLFSFLGVLYYFYQKKKIVKYEMNKYPLVMGFIFQACLTEKKNEVDHELDTLIEALDDYLHNKINHPPIILLKTHMNSSKCSKELRDIILEGLMEVEELDEKK